MRNKNVRVKVLGKLNGERETIKIVERSASQRATHIEEVINKTMDEKIHVFYSYTCGTINISIKRLFTHDDTNDEIYDLSIDDVRTWYNVINHELFTHWLETLSNFLEYEDASVPVATERVMTGIGRVVSSGCMDTVELNKLKVSLQTYYTTIKLPAIKQIKVYTGHYNDVASKVTLLINFVNKKLLSITIATTYGTFERNIIVDGVTFYHEYKRALNLV